MSEYIWLWMLVIVGIVDLVAGVSFLVIDLQKPKEIWQRKIFLLDILFFVLFLVTISAGIYVYFSFQTQVMFFK